MLSVWMDVDFKSGASEIKGTLLEYNSWTGKLIKEFQTFH